MQRDMSKVYSCDESTNVGEKEYEMSKYRFERAKNLQEFLLLYSLFYLNEICIPFYGGTFIQTDPEVTTDNPYATMELGSKFKAITLAGIIATDSQTTFLKDQQKGYVDAFAPNELALELAMELNRYNDIIAFTTPIFGEVCIRNLVVTYDATEEQSVESIKTLTLQGTPYSILKAPFSGVYETLEEWMSDDVKKEFNDDTHLALHIMSPSLTVDSFFVVDQIMRALKKLGKI